MSGDPGNLRKLGFNESSPYVDANLTEQWNTAVGFMLMMINMFGRCGIEPDEIHDRNDFLLHNFVDRWAIQPDLDKHVQCLDKLAYMMEKIELASEEWCAGESEAHEYCLWYRSRR